MLIESIYKINLQKNSTISYHFLICLIWEDIPLKDQHCRVLLVLSCLSVLIRYSTIVKHFVHVLNGRCWQDITRIYEDYIINEPMYQYTDHLFLRKQGPTHINTYFKSRHNSRGYAVLTEGMLYQCTDTAEHSTLFAWHEKCDLPCFPKYLLSQIS